MNPINLIAFGADPEVFLVDQAGQPFSAEGIFGGSKRFPKQMKHLPPGFFIQEDNVAAEFNIPPTLDAEEFYANIQRGLRYIRKVASKRKLAIMLAPDADFPMPQLLTPHAQELGCDPDFNAWTEAKNPRPEPPMTMRTAAAHIHYSWEDPNDEQRWMFVRALDLYLGVRSIIRTGANRRRKLYGKAGACRLKKYGVEYRVLDNYWLDDEKETLVLLQLSKIAAHEISYNHFFREELMLMGGEIQRVINEHDRGAAEKVLAHFRINSIEEW